MIIILVGALAVIGVILGAGIWSFKKQLNKEDPEYILELIKDKSNGKDVALSIKYNHQQWVEINEQQVLPLASTVKTIIAIEYAEQAAKGRINPDQIVNLTELEKFYVPKTDGGAHEAWMSQLDNDTSVPLREIAKGMILYSSNANTEYLMHLLGLDDINKVPEKMGATNHEPLYPIVSALFIPIELMAENGYTKEEAISVLKTMSMEEYRNRAYVIHNRFLSSSPTLEEKHKVVRSLDMDFQKIWSDRLPGSTANDYISIMEKLNSKKFLGSDVHQYLDPVMEQMMKNPNNQGWLMHAGIKGGSTAFVMTSAMYATDKKGNCTEFVFLSNHLNVLEVTKLSKNMNGFQLKFLTDEEFRNSVKEELAEL
ncbi:serine hydrolase [Cytobacillus sp. FJAT-54145]|uniref:Serine hydrolase n=1 Tax=Cytobacillus spartinae TaxID=3299023 RepID=A0ABW6K729_9BACI